MTREGIDRTHQIFIRDRIYIIEMYRKNCKNYRKKKQRIRRRISSYKMSG